MKTTLNLLVTLAVSLTAFGQTKEVLNLKKQMAEGTPTAPGSRTVVPNGQFKKTTLTRDFLSEGAAVADLNRDGRMDIVVGYYWFEAPNWTRHELAPSRIFDPRKRVQ